MTGYENAVEINGLTKIYDGFKLDGLSFCVPKGSIMGFIGQNGSGKSTTIRAMMGIIRRDGGKVRMLGMDIDEHEREIKEQCAVVFDEIPFHDGLSGKQIDIIMKGIWPKWDSVRFREYLDRFALPYKKPIAKLSKGMKMKLQIASALSHDAKLLIMDEATTGLDPVVRNEMLDIFLEYMADGERSILMSSHITSDLDKAADSVTFIDKGQLLLTGYKDDILDTHAVVRCTNKDLAAMDEADYVSARVNDFSAEVLTSDREAFVRKYGVDIEKPSLEDIVLWYVKSKTAKRWS
ncbi:MAG: ABC transporter ATP-binding protein [Oscillospiraceae bacterium]|nr:ABC transporter ATP-binding protein [Oscillospiraceae bacterium]